MSYKRNKEKILIQKSQNILSDVQTILFKRIYDFGKWNNMLSIIMQYEILNRLRSEKSYPIVAKSKLQAVPLQKTRRRIKKVFQQQDLMLKKDIIE